MKKLVFLLLISMFLITGCSVKKADEVTDAEIFASEYAISKDNVFKYATIDDVVELLEEGTGIIFFGNSDQDYSLRIVKMFSNLVEENGIDEVYYYNPTVIRDDVTDEYNLLVSLLGNNLNFTEEGDSYLEIPSVYFVRDGEVIGYSDDAAKVVSIEDENLEEFEEDLKDGYLKLIQDFINEDIK